MLRLIVGLGNPGSKYDKTRHNAGFIFLDQLSARYNCQWSFDAKFKGFLSQCEVGGHKTILLKPQTYMNLSGVSVSNVMNYYRLSADELLVVHDELDLPENVIKLKKNGGHAGHNGLKDVISNIATKDFYRLRIGIGRPSVAMDVATYVLGRTSSEGYESMVGVINRTCDYLPDLLQGDIERLNAILAGKP